MATDTDTRLGRPPSSRVTHAVIAAGLVLVAFVRLGPAFGVAAALVGLAWLGVLAPVLERRRVTAIAERLSRRRLFGALGAPGGEKALLERLRKTLESPEPSEVLYAVDILGKLGHPPDLERRRSLLAHPSADVRRAMVAGTSSLPALLEAVRELLGHDPSPDVRAAAARELAAAGDITELDALAPLLNPRFPAVREGALTGLLASRSVEAATLGIAELERLQASASRDDRAAAAKILGRVGDPRFLSRVEALLGDRDPEVRKHALESAASYPKSTSRLATSLLKGLGERRTMVSAASALVAHGDPAVPELVALYEGEATDEESKRRVLSIVGRIGSASSQRFLWGVVERGTIDHRRQALSWLVSSSARADSASRAVLRDWVEKELDAALWILAAVRDLESVSASEAPDDSLVIASLERELELLRERLRYLLMLLGLLLDEVALERELEALFGLDAATAIFALVSSASTREIPAEAMKGIRAVCPQRMMSREERLQTIVSRSGWLGGWTRATALHRLAQLEPDRGTVAECLVDSSPLVRETAVWLASRLEESGLDERIAKARDDDAELVSRIARYVTERDEAARSAGS